MRSSFTRSAVRALTRAAAKSGFSRLRRLGLLPVRADWVARATACERCPMRVVKCGVSYCGTPFLRMPVRDPVVDGCGCPTQAKARDPQEHCPIDARHEEAKTVDGGGACTCKWCALVPITPTFASAPA
jgi:hypothetical protein